MSTGKYLSLEEARKKGEIERFAKEHPSKTDKDEFDALLEAMTQSKKPEEDD